MGGVQLLQDYSHSKEAVFFITLRNSWYSFYQPQKDEIQSKPLNHPMLLTMTLLDWKSNILTTRSMR